MFAANRRQISPTARVLGFVGAALIAFTIAAAVFAPSFTPYGPRARSGLPYRRPGGGHLLGTNDIGQDLFSQLLHGARVSLTVAAVSAVIAVIVGLVVAVVAGYQRGRTEAVLMGIVDITLAFPFLVLVVVLSTFLGRSVAAMILVLSAVLWARPARVFRSQVLKVIEYGHVTTAQAMGESPLRIVGVHVLPRLVPIVVSQVVRVANIAVLIEAALAFLGLGDVGRISWGSMLYFANTHNAVLTDAWRWWIVPPGLALTVTIVGLAFLGYAIEEWADPRLAIGSGPVIRRTVVPNPGAAATPAMRTEGVALMVDDLHVVYRSPHGDVPAVSGVNLRVAYGRIVGLVGESGSGKSTLALSLLGLHRPPARVLSGHGAIAGHEVTLARRATVESLRGRAVGFVPQNAMSSLNPAYRVLRQVTEAAEVGAMADAPGRAAEMLERVQIPTARWSAFPHELSGGMRQRVAIAAALVNRPGLLVADEPTSGLDVTTQLAILELLIDLNRGLGLGVLLITHDLPMLVRVADDIAVMYAGRIVEHGPTRLIVEDPSHPYTRGLLGSFPPLRGPRVLHGIPGNPPDLRLLPAGCAFAPRCASAHDRCAPERPELTVRADHRSVACVLSDSPVSSSPVSSDAAMDESC